MRNKTIFFSVLISSCLLTINCSAGTGSSSVPPQRRPCYPASLCTGSPTSGPYGGGYGYITATNSTDAKGAESSSSIQNLQPASTQQFVGIVKEVNRVQLPNQTQVQLLLTTDQGDLLVILGPASFIEQAKVRFQAGDKVTVIGYPVNANGEYVVLAAQIEKNGYTLRLLTESRQPLWSNPCYAGIH